MNETDGRTVLIVEDDEATQHLLMALMERSGFESTVAANGAEAIDLLGTTTYGAIILDLMMPSVGGAEVMDFLQREERRDPVIICTARVNPTAGVPQSLVRAVVQKPFDIDQLVNTVETVTTNGRTS
jgi:two-component system response regulator MprA